MTKVKDQKGIERDVDRIVNRTVYLANGKYELLDWDTIRSIESELENPKPKLTLRRRRRST